MLEPSFSYHDHAQRLPAARKPTPSVCVYTVPTTTAFVLCMEAHRSVVIVPGGWPVGKQSPGRRIANYDLSDILLPGRRHASCSSTAGRAAACSGC